VQLFKKSRAAFNNTLISFLGHTFILLQPSRKLVKQAAGPIHSHIHSFTTANHLSGLDCEFLYEIRLNLLLTGFAHLYILVVSHCEVAPGKTRNGCPGTAISPEKAATNKDPSGSFLFIQYTDVELFRFA
jgi:hypothetical protein